MVWVIRDPEKKTSRYEMSSFVVWVPGKMNLTPFSEVHYKWEKIDKPIVWSNKGEIIYMTWLIWADL